MEPIRIAMDAREAYSPNPSGKGLWTRAVIEELANRDVDLTLFVSSASQGLPNNISHIQFGSGLLWHLKVAYRLLRCFPYDYYLSPTSFIVPALIGKRRSCAVVVHDLIAFLPGLHQKKARLIEHLTLKRAAQVASCILSISESTKSDLLARYSSLQSSKIYTVYAGLIGDLIERSSNCQNIVCIAQLCPRKNQLRLIQAYKKLPSNLRSRHRLKLIGGRGWEDQDILDLAHTTEGVDVLGYIPDTECQNHLSSCAVLAYPSLYEGFGLPVLQAMTSGIPVLTSSHGSLLEVAGDAALIVDPESVDSISNGLERLLTDEQLREDLRHKGLAQASKFSWKHTVDCILDAMISL